MKHTITRLLAAASLIGILGSCTHLVYSTDQYMSTFKTKNEVLARFGEPTGKSGSDLVYNYGTNGRGKRRFVKFTFDSLDNVTDYEYQGVNYSKRKPATGKTVTLIGGVIIGIVVVILIGSSLMEWKTN